MQRSSVLSTFFGGLIKGALLGVPIAIAVWGLFNGLNTIGLLPESIQSFTALNAQLAFNCVFGAASIAINNTYQALTSSNTQPIMEKTSLPDTRLREDAVSALQSVARSREPASVSYATHEGTIAASPLKDQPITLH